MKVGTKVKVTDHHINLYRDILFSTNMYPHTGDIDRTNCENLVEMLMWAMADKYPPRGEVIDGFPANPEVDVRVRLRNIFGTYEHYFEKSGLIVIKPKHRKKKKVAK